MTNASGTEGRGQGEHGKAEPLFPSDGQFMTVVPLSQSGVEAARADDAHAPGDLQEQEEETTLVPARVSPAPPPQHTSLAKKGAEHSWAFIAAAVVLSALAGAASGVYVLRLQRPSETYQAGSPAAGVATAGEAAEKVQGAEPAAEPSVPQTLAPSPQAEGAGLAAAPDSPVPPAVPATTGEADAKVEKVNASARPEKAEPQAAEPPARRATEPEPRGGRPARAAVGASPAPRITRAAAAPRRPERNTPAAVAPSAPPLISSPPPSDRQRKVIKWP